MNRGLFSIISILYTSFAHSQVINSTFLGSATVKHGGTYTYKLQLSDSANSLTGYSVTDLMGANETKTAIRGSVNRDKKQISFRETKLIYTKSVYPADSFCYIHANLKLSKAGGATALKGGFEGYRSDGITKCAGGRLTLVSAQDILDKLTKIAGSDSARPKVDTATLMDQVKMMRGESEPSSGDIMKVAPGKAIELACPSPNITVEVWDAKTIDGDIVTLGHNRKVVLENYTITNEHKRLNLKMTGTTDTLKLVAISEGSSPPNTARLKIVSAGKAYFIDATTTLDKYVMVILKRED